VAAAEAEAAVEEAAADSRAATKSGDRLRVPFIPHYYIRVLKS
jgi:hypothetical protein